jgi:hypothetical protein
MGAVCTKQVSDPAVDLQANRTESKRKRKEDKNQDMNMDIDGGPETGAVSELDAEESNEKP